MIKNIFFLLWPFVGVTLESQTLKDGEALLKKMHDRYFEKPCRNYSFSQKNTHYKNDTISGHSEWHENIEFPDKFRIVFGAPEGGNKVVFKNDSAFRYKKGEILSSRRDSSSLLLLLGGMYYRKFDDVLARMNKAGFKTALMSLQNWNGQSVYVIGAKEGDLSSNQLWVEKKDLKVVRILENNGEFMMDMRFESHQPLCKGFVENKVSFRRNGKLEQVEEYYDIMENTPFD